MSRAWLVLFVVAGSHSPAEPPLTQRPAPAAVAAVDAPLDPRLDELARRWDASRLAVSDAPSADAAAGPILLLVGDEIEVAVDRLAEAEHAVLIWAERDLPIATLLPYVAKVPAGVPIYLAARRIDATPPLAWIRARPLEQIRCAAWLSVTDAAVFEVVDAIDGAVDEDDSLVHDNRLCGASWRARLDALQTGGGSLYVRTDADAGPACSQLTFMPDGTLVRAAAASAQPTLTFAYAGEDDSMTLVGPSAGGVRCQAAFAIDGEDAVSLQLSSYYLRGMGSSKRTVPWFYTETSCLAGDAPPKGVPDCLRSVLASTSTRPDAVVDRVGATAARDGSLYVLDDGCRGVKFGARTSHVGGYNVDTTVAYDGASVRITDIEVYDGSGYAEVSESILPVIQTTEDYVLVDGARWYLTRKACQQAASGAP